MFIGILGGLGCALLQSISYICSANFMLKYKSSIRLVIFSQLVMGAFCLPFLPFVLPRNSHLLASYVPWIGAWIVCFITGQFGFFSALRTIEASRLSSLLGLKIPMLALISFLFIRTSFTWLQWLAVLLSALAAVGMNWSGGSHFTHKGIFWLFITMVAYSLTDMVETQMVLLQPGSNMLKNSIVVGIMAYSVLGLVTTPMLLKFRWSSRQFIKASPFAVCWFLSQVALFVCFGYLGAVFGNVIQASRGLLSIVIGLVLAYWGFGKLDAQISRAMWIRRAVCAVLMASGIALYSLAKLQA